MAVHEADHYSEHCCNDFPLEAQEDARNSHPGPGIPQPRPFWPGIDDGEQNFVEISGIHVHPFGDLTNTYDQVYPCKSTLVSKLTRHNPCVPVGRPGWHLT